MPSAGSAIPVPEGVDVAELERLACEVAAAAGRFVVEDRPEDLAHSTKASPTDLVTEMDQRCQELIVRLLGRARPEDAVLGEEEGGTAGSSGITWLVDPIDGTTNYLYRLSGFSVSVAAVLGDVGSPGRWWPVAGAVLDPLSQELFHARAGGGARLTGPGGTRALQVGGTTELAVSLIGTGFGCTADLRLRQARALVEVLPRVRDIRRRGSAALDLCAVACGRLDGYYETGLNVWDRAAGELVAAEAGARLGGPVDAVVDGDLLWVAAPGIAGRFAPLVRAATSRWVTGGPAPAESVTSP